MGIHYGFACYFAITLSNAAASLSEDIKEHLWPFISFYSAAITLEKPDLSLGAFRKDGPFFKKQTF